MNKLIRHKGFLIIVGALLFGLGFLCSFLFVPCPSEQIELGEYLDSIHSKYSNKIKLVEALNEEDKERMLFLATASLISDLNYICEDLDRLPKDRHNAVWWYAQTYQDLLTSKLLKGIVEKYKIKIPQIEKTSGRGETTMTYIRKENKMGNKSKRKQYHYKH